MAVESGTRTVVAAAPRHRERRDSSDASRTVRGTGPGTVRALGGRDGLVLPAAAFGSAWTRSGPRRSAAAAGNSVLALVNSSSAVAARVELHRPRPHQLLRVQELGVQDHRDQEDHDQAEADQQVATEDALAASDITYSSGTEGNGLRSGCGRGFPAEQRRAESQYFDEARCFPRGAANEQAMSVRIAEKLEGILAVDAAAVQDCTDGIA